MTYDEKLEKLKERLDSAEEFNPEMIGQVLSGDVSLGKAAKSFAASKTKKWIDRRVEKAKYKGSFSRKYLMPFDPDYDFIKNVVEKTLVDGPMYHIEESTDLGRNLGQHGPNGMYVLEKSQIPEKIFGNKYGKVLKRLGKSPDELNQDVQNYIKLHEVTEKAYMEKYGIANLNDNDHGKLEAYILKSLETFPLESYDTTGILEAAVAVHSMRNKNDKFLKMTKKYMKDLGDRIDNLLTPNSLTPEYAYV